jgi:hypothetical protein
VTKDELLALSPSELTALPAVDMTSETRAWTNAYCTSCVRCYRCVHCHDCYDCSVCYDCNDCIGITHGWSLRFVAWGMQLTEDEYRQLRAKM